MACTLALRSHANGTGLVFLKAAVFSLLFQLGHHEDDTDSYFVAQETN